MFISMRKLCPNYDKEDGLDTVLEVPIPEEMFTNMGSNGALRWQNLRALMRAQGVDKSTHLAAASNNEFMALLKLVGTPLIPFQVQPDEPLTRPIKDCSIVSIYINFSSLFQNKTYIVVSWSYIPFFICFSMICNQIYKYEGSDKFFFPTF